MIVTAVNFVEVVHQYESASNHLEIRGGPWVWRAVASTSVAYLDLLILRAI